MPFQYKFPSKYRRLLRNSLPFVQVLLRRTNIHTPHMGRRIVSSAAAERNTWENPVQNKTIKKPPYNASASVLRSVNGMGQPTLQHSIVPNTALYFTEKHPPILLWSKHCNVIKKQLCDSWLIFNNDAPIVKESPQHMQNYLQPWYFFRPQHLSLDAHRLATWKEETNPPD